ncbi:MAG: DNA internalization-related competence protein ComEC/Rec2, partial [Rhodothermales bacterium]|nr:DNA internalization-related competence protein ComEC/Rec2 [Rhodothermales bacterium]
MPRTPPDQPLRWRARPLLLVAACFAGGITAEHHAVIGLAGWLMIEIGALAGAALVLIGTRRRLVSLRRLGLTAAAGTAVLAGGAAWLAAAQQVPPHGVEVLAARTGPLPVDLFGRVAGHPEDSPRGVRLTLEADSASWGDGATPVAGRVQVALRQPVGEAPQPYPVVRAGDVLRVTGPLRPLQGRRNPADFDYGAWLARRGIGATLAGYDTSTIAVLAHAPGPAERVAVAVRAHVRTALDAHVRSDGARAVLRALLLADRGGIDPEVRDAFAVTGLMHLLAVSGLHVLLVGMLLYRLLKPLLGRLGWRWRTAELTRLLLTLALLGGYVLVTGAPGSAVRALVMAAVLLAGTALERPPNPLNALGLAALVLLLARPMALFDVGFQLSFAAVGGIVLLLPVLESAVPERWTAWKPSRWTVGMTLVSLAATLGTMPVLLVHFGRVPMAGLGLNLAAIPLTAAALASGLLCIATAGWAPAVADLSGASARLAADALLLVSEWGAEWLAWTSLGGYVRSLPLLSALIAALAALALWPRPRLRWRAVGLALGLAALGVWLPVLHGDARPALEVWFLDVGQGDAALVRLPNGRHLLVDAGLRDAYRDAGARTVLPHLRYLGVDRLDAVVVTHPHADHNGGVPAVLRGVDVAQVVHNGHNSASAPHAEAVRLAAERGTRVRTVAAGDTLGLDPSVRIRVLHPGAPPHPAAPANAGSVVLHVAYGRTSFLFTGDLEAEGEAALLRRYPSLLKSTVVKVGHHGSRTSSTPGFVAATAPEVAVVPVAE